MSEQELRNPETGENQASEQIIEEQAAETSAQPQWDADKENAPAEKKEEQAKPAKKNRKKKKKNRVPVQVAIILAAVGLIFGVILGYTVGRSSADEEVAVLQDMLSAITSEQLAQEEAEAQERELEEANEEALADLAGGSMSGDSGELDVADGILEDMESEESSAPEAPVVVAEFNGGQLMSDAVLAEYNEQLTDYLFAGYSEEEVAPVLLEEVLRYMVSDQILSAKAKEMGLYQLNSVDQERIVAQAQQDYAEQVEFYENFVYEAGMSDDQLAAAAQAYLLEMEGVTLETVQADIEEGWWMQKLYDEMVKNVSVASGDILAAYNAKLEAQKENFTAYPEEFELASINGEPILYNLDNYRAVRMLLLPFESADAMLAVADISEEIAELNPETDAQQIAEMQAQLDGYYAFAETTGQEVLGKLQAGGDFIALLDQYGDDIGMKDAAVRERGYYVSADSLLWSRSMIDAAMALAKPGEISGLVRTDEGVCILQYVGAVQPGTVDMAKVYDAISEETLEEARYLAYENQVSAWLEEAGVQYYPERLQ